MKAARRVDSKAHFLAQWGALHRHPERVQDALFHAGTFFDPRDLIQVRYEMVRRFRVNGQAARAVARSFGHFGENDREESQGNSPTRFSFSHGQHYGK
jgi:hypothetical protein